jgi:predicted Zn-dependent protease
MQLVGTFYDGETADPKSVTCLIRGNAFAGFLEVKDVVLDHKIAYWPLDSLVPVPARKGELHLSSTSAPAGARLIFREQKIAERVHQKLPMLSRFHRRRRARQFRTITLASAALASVVGAYLFGVPLLAGRIVMLIPPETETGFGEKIVVQMASALQEQGGLQLCDPNPDSVANQAIQRFAREAVAGTGTPFEVNIAVAANSIPNAFALPGGQAFYFKGLLIQTQTADEFAGVMAHEIGHVVNRDGMKQLVASAGTGLLVGFVLGDITGISIAAGLGTALIETSFSREAERKADEFAFGVAQRLSFDPTGLADLLGRIADDDANSRAFALLSTHPLTQERRAALENMGPVDIAVSPAFSQTEWQAIKNMCGNDRAGKIKAKGG